MRDVARIYVGVVRIYVGVVRIYIGVARIYGWSKVRAEVKSEPEQYPPSSLDYRVCHKLQILSLQLKKRNFNFFGIAPARIWTQNLLITGLAPQTTHPSWVVLKWSGKKVVYKFEFFGNIFNFPSKKMKKHTENIFKSSVETFKRKDLSLPMQK